MSTLDDLLRSAAAEVHDEMGQVAVPAAPLPGRGRRPKWRASVTAGLAAAAVVVIAVLVAFAARRGGDGQRQPRPPVGDTTAITSATTTFPPDTVAATVPPPTAATTPKPPTASVWHGVFGSSAVLDDAGLVLLGSDSRQTIALGHELCGGPIDAARVWATSDLSRWTPGVVGRGNLSPTVSVCPLVEAVAATPDGRSFVAVGTAGDAQHTIGRVWRSADGVHWSTVDASAFDNAQLATVVTGHGVLVAGGAAAHAQQSLGQFVAWSADGTTWHRIGLSDNGGIAQVVSGPAGFFAIGRGSGSSEGRMSVWWSADGRHWSAGRGLDANPVGNEVGLTSDRGYSILASDDTSGAKVLYESSDGRRWTRRSVTGFGDLDNATSIARMGTRLFAIGFAEAANPNGYEQAMWVSEDGGRDWARVALPVMISDRSVISAIGGLGDQILVAGGFYPTNPVAAKPAAVPRVWSVTVN